jgi:hypothetical protein
MAFLKNCNIKGDGMDTHFIFGLVLVGFAFWLCFKFRQKK